MDRPHNMMYMRAHQDRDNQSEKKKKEEKNMCGLTQVSSPLLMRK